MLIQNYFPYYAYFKTNRWITINLGHVIEIAMLIKFGPIICSPGPSLFSKRNGFFNSFATTERRNRLDRPTLRLWHTNSISYFFMSSGNTKVISPSVPGVGKRNVMFSFLSLPFSCWTLLLYFLPSHRWSCEMLRSQRQSLPVCQS